MKKIASAVLALMAIGAQAADDGVYVGVTHNHFALSGDGSGSDNAFGLYAGYRMGFIAGEVSRFQKTVDGDKFVYTDIAAIPHLNLAKDVDLIGKVGIRSSEVSGGGFKDSGTSIVVGAGIEYSFMPQLTARALVDYSNKSYGLSGVRTTTTTIGVAYKF